MQTDKALLKFGDITVIELITVKMKQIFKQVIISANNEINYSFLNLPIILDEFIDKGPLSGLHASIKSSGTEKNFVISCDMPLISSEMINFLAEYDSEKEIILPTAHGKVQQLCGVYSKSVNTEIEKIFNLSEADKNIKGSIFELLEEVSTEFVDVESLPFYDKNIFLNMNTQQDYELIKNIYVMK
ncbi:MAG: molybdenum cofactor guanylyltransferase [Ignavibacteriales bacterium]|nr:molybdenum cofactor guanylyltransferase [Ignavibacteriales bacterium]